MKGAKAFVGLVCLSVAAGAARAQIGADADRPVPDRYLAVYRAGGFDGGSFEADGHLVSSTAIEKIARESGPPGEYRAEARIAWKTMPQQVAEARAFSTQPIPATPAEWISTPSGYMWRGAAAASHAPLRLELRPQPGPTPFRVGDFQEFWLDYTVDSEDPPCRPRLELNLRMPAGGNRGAIQEVTAFAETMPEAKVLSTIDARDAEWRPKDASYLVSRLLGLAPDGRWRYTQSEGFAVLQRRMHQGLDNIDKLDIRVSPGVRVEQVNLRVGRSDSYRGGDIVEFSGLSKAAQLPGGRAGIRLNLRDALNDRYPNETSPHSRNPGPRELYLQEVTIFVPGDAQALVARHALLDIEYVGTPRPPPVASYSDGRVALRLPNQVTDLDDGRRRMVVDLRPVNQQGEAGLNGASLELLPPQDGASCAVRFSGAWAVSSYQEAVPAYVRPLESWTRHLGNVSVNPGPPPGHVPDPGLLEHLYFASLTGGAHNELQEQPEASTEADALSRAAPQDAAKGGDFRVVTAEGKAVGGDGKRLVSTRGATLRAEGGMPTYRAIDGRLQLRGRSRAIEINWPVALALGPSSWFTMSVAHGTDEIASVSLELERADGTSLRRAVLPNHARYLGVDGGQVRGVKLRIVPSKVPFRIELGDMAFFEPHAATLPEAISIPVPEPHVVRPVPVIDAATPASSPRSGEISGLAPVQHDLHFSTRVQPQLTAVRMLKIAYRVPVSFLDGDGCPLTLRLIWTKGHTERRVCFDKTNGTMDIPGAALVDSNGNPADIGPLESMDWTIRPGPAEPLTDSHFFDFKISVDGWASLSAQDRMRLSPMFHLGSRAVFADEILIDRMKSSSRPKTFSFPIDGQVVISAIKSNGIVPDRDSDVALEEVLVEPGSALSDAQWQQLLAPPSAPQRVHWLQMVSWVAAALVAWLAWRRGLWQRIRWGAIRTAAVHATSKSLRRLGALASRCASPFNVAIGIAALGPGLWVAGRIGYGFAGAMVLVCASMVAWGAYRHWRSRPGSGPDLDRGATRVVFALAVGCAIWAVGQYGVAPAAAWGLLPLFGAAYIALPAALAWATREPATAFRAAVLVSWLLLASILYGAGAIAGSGGESPLFTLAAFCIVLALRSGFMAAELWLRKRFPSLARLYDDAGGVYFACALVALAASALFLALGLELPSQQAAVVIYFSMVIGVVKEAWAIVHGAPLTATDHDRPVR